MTKHQSGSLGIVFAPPKQGKTALLAGLFLSPRTLWITQTVNSVQMVCNSVYGTAPTPYAQGAAPSGGGTILCPPPGKVGGLEWLIDQLTAVLEKSLLGALGSASCDKDGATYTAIVIDDLTHFCKPTMSALTAAYSQPPHARYRDDGSLDLGGAYRDANTLVEVRVMGLLKRLASVGQVWATTHKADVRRSKDGAILAMGGPMLCSKAQAPRVAAEADICVELVTDETYLDSNPIEPFRRAIRQDPDARDMYPYCDRSGACYAATPPSLRAAYIMAGYEVSQLPRQRNCRWQDQLMLMVADRAMNPKQRESLWEFATQAGTINRLDAKALTRFAKSSKSSGTRHFRLMLRQAYQEGLALGIMRNRQNNLTQNLPDLNFLKDNT